MEGLIAILILGWCVWMLIRHPLKSLSFVFKVGFLLVLGTVAAAVLLGLIFWGASTEL
jgi:hypothetical protein